MRTRKLGRTGLDISVLGLGTSTLGADPANDADAVATIHRAADAGVNWIDTAPIYGERRSEEIVGRALGTMAEKPLVFAKTSMSLTDGQIVHRLDRASIRREFESTLQRLGVDAVDVLFVHWPIPDERLEEGWGALAELKAEGKTRFLGASNFDIDQLRRASVVAPVDVVQASYSAIQREPEVHLVPYCETNDIGFVAFSPMGAGLFMGAITRDRLNTMEGDWRKNWPPFREPRLTQNLRLYDTARQMASDQGISPGALAVAWVLAQPGVAGAIIGARRPEWIDEIVPAADLELSAIDRDVLSAEAG